MIVKSPEGKEFWICFMRNHDDPERVTKENMLHLELFITSEETANVTVEIKGLNFKEENFANFGNKNLLKKS